MSSTMFSASSDMFSRLEDIDEKSELQQFFMQEERKEKVEEATRSSNVQAMKEMFEQASITKEESPKQRLSCGSQNSVAERRRQLQQALSLEKDEVSEANSQPSKKKEDDSHKDLARRLRAKAISAHRRNRFHSRIADKKKMFEKTHPHAQGDELGPEVATERLKSHCESTEQDPTLAMTISESEFSALVYSGSLFSDDTRATRDDNEAARRPQAPEKREVHEPQITKQKGLTYGTSLSPNNSFQVALHEIVQSFQDEADIQKAPFGPISQLQPEKEVDGFGLQHAHAKHSTVYVMDSSRADDPSPVSMLTSFDTDFPQHSHGSSKGSLASGDMLQLTNGQGFAFGSHPTTKEASGPLTKVTREYPPSEVHPNSSLFSTVEQEEERERAEEERERVATEKADEETSKDRPYDEPTPPDVFEPAVESHEDEQTPEVFEPAPQRQDRTYVEQTAEVFEPAHERQDRIYVQQQAPEVFEPALERQDRTHDEQSPEVFEQALKEQPCSSKPVAMGSVHISQIPLIDAIMDEQSHEEVDAFPASQTPRFEIADDTPGTQPIKGILKNKQEEKHQEEPKTPTSPISQEGSETSWYSSATSACSDLEQQMAPLQNAGLLLPALQSSRFSIGGYVNAHLAETPPTPVEHELSSSSHHNSHPQKEPHRNHNENRQWSAHVKPPRQERRDSMGTSVSSFSRTRNQAASPSSMDPQYSQSQTVDHQDLQEIANSMTAVAGTASTAVLDALVDCADKVVVAPLLSLFSCVDESERLLCSGVNAAEECFGVVVHKKRRRHKKARHRHSRKFKA